MAPHSPGPGPAGRPNRPAVGTLRRARSGEPGRAYPPAVALIDRYDRRALLLGALPAAAWVVLLLYAVLPPSIGWRAALPLAGVVLLSYVPLAWLGVTRAWGDLGEPPSKSEELPSSWAERLTLPYSFFWFRRGFGVYFVLITVGVARFHWLLIQYAKERLAAALGHHLYEILRPTPPSGVALFGDDLVLLGIVIPLLFVGLAWFLLPCRA